MKALRIFGICISIAGFALIALSLVAMVVVFNHFGYLPVYGEPDPTATDTLGITLTFAYAFFLMHFTIILQFVYLLLKLFLKQLQYKLVLASFVLMVVLLLLFEYSQLHYFFVWALD
ncbi:MAG: hypothetical protein A2W93_02105 [Bacteroidetes bacterium GWF2_43_63]|nr:MAG: hypothetical protein A2W94_09970 [Bacteroidetes bacterium GWE2_42_42]OFY55859.1 MAG: hypothetical protein A2W93_02105 [Bacteroidetes bacterium GWF2_43_63]HBG71220.1 hypothetical protein [Bacteroidales bacterium]HCB60559.1 hypothetical protein [Bacteroidales bacterium]HCY22484.1 hypothetical protein [Bacteroidales bacterium]